MADRWATFDCYGTLIDWNASISAVLVDVFGEHADVRPMLRRYHELEPEIESGRYLRYREVLDRCLARLAAERGRELAVGEATALSGSLSRWPAFPEVPRALAELKRR